MDKSAIQHIQESANIACYINQLIDAETRTPVAVLPDSMGLHSLEKFMPTASHYRMDYTTSSLSEFIEYAKDHDQEGAACFIDAREMAAKSIFDLGTPESPGHKVSWAKLCLENTAAFAAISRINGIPQAQKEAAELIEDWDDSITAYSADGDTMNLASAASSLRDLTIEAAREVSSKVGDFSESMSSMERIEAKHQHLIPVEIHFKCAPYHGLGTRTLIMRVSIRTGADRPQVVFRILQLEAIREDIADEFKQKIVAATKSMKLKTFIGTTGK